MFQEFMLPCYKKVTASCATTVVEIVMILDIG